MIAAVMQPYFFPYIGYFQLMKAVDVFVFLDDAQYINRGWVNRNQIRVGDVTTWLTLPVRRASSTLPINQRHYLLEESTDRIKRKLRGAYARAPANVEMCPYVYNLLDFSDPNVAAFNINLLTQIAREIGIDCAFRLSSEIDKPAGLTGEAKILDLCYRVGAKAYINPVGGAHLYAADHFAAAGIGLSFLRTTVPAAQLDTQPQHLSIIDGLMHRGFDECATQLSKYEIVDPEAPDSFRRDSA